MLGKSSVGYFKHQPLEIFLGHASMGGAVERHVVLIAPDVHWNTGNIGRTCIGVDAFLHLIKPIGFSLESREVKRAGLDYWHQVKLSVWEDFNHFISGVGPEKEEIALFSKNGRRSFREMPSLKRLFLVFGSETQGIPQKILDQHQNATYYIPISKAIRCLNLSTSVGVVLFESLRGMEPPHGWLNEKG
jgi:tRNA (cytidine/uridine-2'-O-)-methyltransferase